MLSSARIQQRLAQRSIALVLAGGRGSRLKHLTDRRAKPAVFFGGKFRIIDFALSNCLNSGVRRIAVLTQYKAHSLLRHLQMGWSFLRPEMNEFLDLLPAQQRLDEATWYRGTADAVYQNFDIFRAAGPEFFIVLAGDHIYKMDYSNMLADHMSKGADCTVACVEVPLAEASDFGVMAVDASMTISNFLEKPRDPPAMAGRPDRALASMGVYVFTAEFLYAELERDHRDPTSNHDFGKDVIPNLVSRGLAVAHSFEASCVKTTPEAEAYWRDVGTPTAIGQPISISSDRRHLSTFTIRIGRSGRISSSSHRPNSCSTMTTGAAWPSTRWSQAGASFPARPSAAPFCFPTAASIRTFRPVRRSCCPMSSSAGMLGSTRWSSTVDVALRKGW
jgi:glucose-1-phosphate adenylyltransferase